jgi:hypothetical protein
MSKQGGSSVAFEDDDSSIDSAGGFSLPSLGSSVTNDTKTVGSRQVPSYNRSREAGKVENEKFLRKKYLAGRARKLKQRLQDRPFDVRALTEYSEVLYEQQNFGVAQKVIRRLIAAGDNSGHWHLKLGKCYYRRWLEYRSARGEKNCVTSSPHLTNQTFRSR